MASRFSQPSQYTQYYRFLCRKDVAITSGFIWGMSQHVGINKRTAQAPLTTLFSGTITGFIFGIGTSLLVGNLLPPPLVGLIPIMTTISIVSQNTIYLGVSNENKRVDLKEG
ncbi:MAG: hypothetical protein Homavirus44_1 [Homavirus sp.]|uniref:Uncharacterized protein n=1 Tax=Homavirus sp. TaxID=2487769 RepID=A0A3G5A7A7_9VIRU|nr:MAG: hypothetical protein Homavirus44_1 [Homavirus sp.]